jgi:hypothetical protein
MFNFMQPIQGEVSRREHRLPGVMDRSTRGRLVSGFRSCFWIALDQYR